VPLAADATLEHVAYHESGHTIAAINFGIPISGAVAVRSEAFRDREFAGKVMSISPMVQPARINSPGSGNVTDFSVTDVLIKLADPGPLLVGMKVDVYFQRETVSQ
jgi:hypothetical protein